MRKEQSSCKIVDKGTENKILRNTKIDSYGLKCHLETWLFYVVDLFFKFIYFLLKDNCFTEFFCFMSNLNILRFDIKTFETY